MQDLTHCALDWEAQLTCGVEIHAPLTKSLTFLIHEFVASCTLNTLTQGVLFKAVGDDRGVCRLAVVIHQSITIGTLNTFPQGVLFKAVVGGGGLGRLTAVVDQSVAIRALNALALRGLFKAIGWGINLPWSARLNAISF